MKVELLSPNELTETDRTLWQSHIAASPELGSPFFQVGFFDDVATVRGDTKVMRAQSETGTAYLPVNVGARNAGPIAATMSDFEGLIATREFSCEPGHLIAEAGLKSWRFQHLVGNFADSPAAVWAKVDSAYIDLSAGFDAYRDERRQTRGRLIREIERKLRKAERELQDVSLVWDDRDPAALDWLVSQKSAQLVAQNEWNFLTVPWAVPLYQRTLTHTADAYRGRVSTLRYDGKIVAAHMGLQAGPVLHSWTHVFDPAEAKHSPGMVMMYLLAKTAAENGVARIDLGRGDEGYKSRFANQTMTVSEGGVDTRLLHRLAGRTWCRGREAVRASALAKPAQSFVRKIRNLAKQTLASTASHAADH